MTDLILDGLSVARSARTLLHPLSARIAAGEMVAVVGPNGAGKSTLLRAIAQLVPVGGHAQFGAAALHVLSPHQRAQLVGYLPQSHHVAWSMPVRDMVALGLYAHGTAGYSAAGSADIDAMLDLCGIADLADRPIDRLSGGELAMAALARVLVARTPILLLDEPVAALDIGRQYQLLERLAALAAEGRTVLIVLHDLGLVSQFASRILWLSDGHLVADTPCNAAAIDAYAGPLMGRAPQWTPDGTLYFQR